MAWREVITILAQSEERDRNTAGIMITIARNVVTGRCERCGRVLLISMVKDEAGMQLFWCGRCIATAGVEGCTDPLKTMEWPRTGYSDGTR